jgi:hypothetical protein
MGRRYPMPDGRASGPTHALGCVFGLSMGDREYPAWRFKVAECGCIDTFGCPAIGCCGVLRVRSGPRCHEGDPVEGREASNVFMRRVLRWMRGDH